MTSIPPLLRRSAPALAALVGLGVLYLVRPGVVENAARSPLAWAVVTGTVLAAVGIRVLARRLGASPLVAQALSTGVVVALLVVVLLPSFQQRTLVEDLPDELTSAAGPVAGPVVPLATGTDPGTTTGTPPPSGVPTTSAAAPAGRQQATTTTGTTGTTGAPAAAPAPRATAGAPGQPPAPATGSSATPATQPAAQPSSRPTTQQPEPGPEAVDRTGELKGIGHTASGTVFLRTSSGKAYVVFSDVNIEGTVEPSVHLVPPGGRTPSGGIRLGALKAEKGTFSYLLPGSVDLSKQWSVLVWCDPYDTPIAAADPR